MQGKIKYKLQLSSTESIIFVLEENTMNFVDYDTFAISYFVQEKIKTLLTRDTLYESCYCLSILLQKVLTNEFIFEEKNSDIGFLASEIAYKELILEQKLTPEEDQIDYCVLNYCWLSPVIKRGNIKTWIYNDGKGNIVLFLAPVYPFFFRRGKNYLPYPEWIKTYKPLAKRIIPKSVAQQWLTQAEEIMQLISDNNKKNEHAINIVKPKNGQKALDNSIAFKKNTSARVSVAENEFVILTKANSDRHHGHVLPWDELELAMQDALVDAKLATENGRIMWKN